MMVECACGCDSSDLVIISALVMALPDMRVILYALRAASFNK